MDEIQPTTCFFGFTHCPGVCPTTLFGMSQHLKELGPEANRLKIVFVTAAPAGSVRPRRLRGRR
jgi:protein SCO1/2